MDKRTILAFLLIGFILILTQTKFYKDLVIPQRNTSATEVIPDSMAAKKDTTSQPIANKNKAIESPKQAPTKIASEKNNPFAALFQASKDTSYEDVIIETDSYIAHINPNGAVISSWILKKFQYNNSTNVQLIQDKGRGNLGVFFINDGDTVYTYDSKFEPEKKEIQFTEKQLSDSIRFVLDLGDNRKLIKTYKFYRDQYIIDLNIEIENLADQFDNNQYHLIWDSGLAYTEVDYSNYIDKEDINNSKAYVFQGGSREELNLPNRPFETKTRSDFSGVVDWVAVRNKYFAMVVIPNREYTIEPTLHGETFPIYKDVKLRDRVNKKFSVTLKSSLLPSNLDFVSQQFRIYIGPLDYYLLKDYQPTLSKIMDFGMVIIRPFAILVLKTFVFLHKFIPNYGIVLIIFSILIKILLQPLTKKSTSSMQKMQTLQPRLNELKEKYSKDPQRLNKETMKLYKESGINPLGGCLPTLLQLPLLWAIFIVFRYTIELRDASFIWWIKDLSAPDTIYQLPFSIPFYGNLVNILPIFMGVTMFIQQKMTMKDPKQKSMVYFMPIFMTLLFNSFPSGLNLYYALFNLFSIIQQKYMPAKEASNNAGLESQKAKKAKINYFKRK